MISDIKIDDEEMEKNEEKIAGSFKRANVGLIGWMIVMLVSFLFLQLFYLKIEERCQIHQK